MQIIPSSTPVQPVQSPRSVTNSNSLSKKTPSDIQNVKSSTPITSPQINIERVLDNKTKAYGFLLLYMTREAHNATEELSEWAKQNLTTDEAKAEKLVEEFNKNCFQKSVNNLLTKLSDLKKPITIEEVSKDLSDLVPKNNYIAIVSLFVEKHSQNKEAAICAIQDCLKSVKSYEAINAKEARTLLDTLKTKLSEISATAKTQTPDLH